MATGVTGDGARIETAITMTPPARGAAGGGADGVANLSSGTG